MAAITVHTYWNKIKIIVIVFFHQHFYEIIIKDLEYEYQKDRNKEYSSTSAKGPFHTRFRVLVELIFEDPTVTVKWRTTINAMYIYLELCQSVMLDRLACSFTSIFSLTQICYSEYLSWPRSHVSLQQYISLQNNISCINAYFVCYFWQVRCFIWLRQFSPPIKLTDGI